MGIPPCFSFLQHSRGNRLPMRENRGGIYFQASVALSSRRSALFRTCCQRAWRRGARRFCRFFFLSTLRRRIPSFARPSIATGFLLGRGAAVGIVATIFVLIESDVRQESAGGKVLSGARHGRPSHLVDYTRFSLFCSQHSPLTLSLIAALSRHRSAQNSPTRRQVPHPWRAACLFPLLGDSLGCTLEPSHRCNGRQERATSQKSSRRTKLSGSTRGGTHPAFPGSILLHRLFSTRRAHLRQVPSAISMRREKVRGRNPESPISMLGRTSYISAPPPHFVGGGGGERHEFW